VKRASHYKQTTLGLWTFEMKIILNVRSQHFLQVALKLINCYPEA